MMNLSSFQPHPSNSNTEINTITHLFSACFIAIQLTELPSLLSPLLPFPHLLPFFCEARVHWIAQASLELLIVCRSLHLLGLQVCTGTPRVSFLPRDGDPLVKRMDHIVYIAQ